MKPNPFLVGLVPVLVSWLAQGQLTEIDTYNPNLSIPDGNATGISDSHIISGSPLTSITGLTVDLNITGNFNGDLYFYLRHEHEITPGNFVPDGFAVLLNRVGRTLANSSGYADSGFSVSLSDSAPADIHNYQNTTTPAGGSPLTDNWQPDARNIDPSSVLDASPRNAFLSSFDGLDANGRWTLFGADVESGGSSQVISWQLNISAVPEPQTWAGITALGLVGFAAWRRFRDSN
jgi:subtilisin-like proprotein convertase family protein